MAGFQMGAFLGKWNTHFNSLQESPLPGREKKIPHFVVGDDAFPLRRHHMKPFPFNSQGSMRIFNYRLSRARRIVENFFGIISAVFRVLRRIMLLQPHKAGIKVTVICCLHNFLLSEKHSKNV